MRQRLVWPILLTTMLSVDAGAPQQDSSTGKNGKGQVTCRIWASSSFSPRAGGPILHVSIENGSYEAVTITAMAGHLSGKNVSEAGSLPKSNRSYWSPIDVEKKSALKPVRDSKGAWTYPEGRIFLKTAESIEFSLDLSALEWSDERSAVLPSAKLFAVVPSGTYEIYLGLEAHDRLGRFSVESNKTIVEIQKQSTKTQ